MTINATAAILLALYVAVARRRGVPEDALSGTVQNDILKEYVARGHLHLPARARPCAWSPTSSRYCAEQRARAGTRSRSPGYHIREAGATAPQEMAFTFANALEYVRAARAAGLRTATRFGERVSFFFACHSDFIEEVAKFRAARRLWARLVKETAGRRATRKRPAPPLPRADGRGDPHRAAAGQQRGAGGPAGPGRGAGRLPEPAHQRQGRGPGPAHRGRRRAWPCARSRSSRTSRGWPTPWTRWAAPTRWRRPPTRSRREARRLLDRDRGRRRGAARPSSGARSSGEIQESAYRHQREVESGERVIVGVNRCQEGGEAPPGDVLRIDPELERAQVERVRALRARRAAGPVEVGPRRAWRSARAAAATWCRPWWRRCWPGPRWGRSPGRLRRVFGEHRETLVL